jgi:hypothetical protein
LLKQIGEKLAAAFGDDFEHLLTGMKPPESTETTQIAARQ